MSRNWIGALMLAAAAPGCLASDEPAQMFETDEVVAKTTQPLQIGNGHNVHLVDNTVQTDIKYSVAALYLTDVKATQPFATCGMTWVSQHYGVTAAHCVEHLPLNNGQLVAEDLWVTQLDQNELAWYVTVLGNWPDFWNGSSLSTGYFTARYACSVVRRCSTTYGHESCPIAEDVDIALVHCPERGFRERAETAAGFAAFGLPTDVDDWYTFNVNTWWFHEVYNMPASDDGSDRWLNYGRYLGQQSALDNWHYTREHQLLPLLSHDDPNGTLYSTVPSTLAVLNEMDTPVCHGTSGSGVFVSGTNYFLGPAISAGDDSELGGKLCEPATNAAPGKRLTTYVRGAITASFVSNSGEVQTDLSQFP